MVRTETFEPLGLTEVCPLWCERWVENGVGKKSGVVEVRAPPKPLLDRRLDTKSVLLRSLMIFLDLQDAGTCVVECSRTEIARRPYLSFALS